MRKLLNDLSVRSAPQGTIWDTNLTGFGLRVGKNRRTFLVLVGSGRRKKIGLYPLLSVAQAREHAKKILAEKTLGAIVPKHTTFDEAKKRYLEDCAKRLRPGTLAQYRWLMGLTDFRKSLGDITGADVLRVLNAQTPSNRDHLFKTLRAFFGFCFKSYLIDKSPMERLTPPPISKVRERVLTDEELAKVYKASRTAKTPLHSLVYLLIRTGQRPGEIRRLKPEYISPDRITLPASLTKNKREHTFPISKDTYKFLEHFEGFPGIKSLRSHLTDFRDECGIEPFQLRDFRKTFATGLQKLGVRIEVTEAFINHITFRAGLVGTYQRHSYFPEMVEAEKLWSRHLSTLVR